MTTVHRLMPRLFCLLAAFCATAGLLRAQQNLPSSLSPRVISRGQTSQFSINYTGPQVQPEALPQISVPGLEIDGPQQSTSMSYINGQVRFSMDLIWTIYAEQPGTYVIPPQQVTLSGQTYTTAEARLEVRDGPAPTVSYEPVLRLAVGKESLFVGELAPVTLTAFFHGRTLVRNYDHPKLPRENFVVKRFPPPNPAPMAEINGERYQPIQFSSALTALKDGELELGPATLECLVDFPVADDPAQRSGARGLPPTFFQRSITRKFTMQSDKVTVHVKPLPAEGRPAGFAGAVGRFSLVSRVTQPVQQLRVGDPISVDLYVTGQGNFDSVSAPLLETPEGWRLYPSKVTQENRNAGLEPGTVAWNQVIVPQRVMTAVPPFTLAFFDPEQEKYVTVTSQAIPIQMINDPAATAAGGGGDEAPTRDFSLLDAGIPEEQLTDIVTARPDRGTLRSLTPMVADEAVWWAAQALPAAVVLALAGVGMQRRVRRKADEERRRTAGQPREPVTVWKDLRRSGQPRREFYSLAREYVDSWQHYRRQPAASAGLNGELDLILSRQGYYAYAGSDAEGQTPIPEPEQKEILTALDRLPR